MRQVPLSLLWHKSLHKQQHSQVYLQLNPSSFCNLECLSFQSRARTYQQTPACLELPVGATAPVTKVRACAGLGLDSALLGRAPSAVPLWGFTLADMGSGSRQARLDRYREKKRTRGFSSKIRYEMRKINAERRPRVKVCSYICLEYHSSQVLALNRPVSGAVLWGEAFGCCMRQSIVNEDPCSTHCCTYNQCSIQ